MRKKLYLEKHLTFILKKGTQVTGIYLWHRHFKGWGFSTLLPMFCLHHSTVPVQSRNSHLWCHYKEDSITGRAPGPVALDWPAKVNNYVWELTCLGWSQHSSWLSRSLQLRAAANITQPGSLQTKAVAPFFEYWCWEC